MEKKQLFVLAAMIVVMSGALTATSYPLIVEGTDAGTAVYVKESATGGVLASAISTSANANLSVPGDIVFYVETDPPHYGFNYGATDVPLSEFSYIFNSSGLCVPGQEWCSQFDYNFGGYMLWISKLSFVVSYNCTDWDGGKNYFQSAAVRYHGAQYEDSCSENQVAEQYCDGDGASAIDYYECPPNYVCKEGACVNKIPASGDFASISIGIVTNNGTIDPTANATINGYVNMYRMTQVNGQFYGTLLETEPSFSTTGAVFTVPYANNYDPPYYVEFRAFKSNEKAVANTAWTTNTQPSQNLRYRINGYDTLCIVGFGTENCYTSAGLFFSDDEIPSSVSETKCLDYDGKDIYRQDGALETNVTSSFMHLDYCADSYNVMEYTCPSPDSPPIASIMPCGNGYYCLKGACVKNNKTCNDSIGRQGTDGRNDAYVVNFGYSYIYGDFCMDDYTARKYWCSGNELNSEDLQCPGSTICRNGVCGTPSAEKYENLTIQLDPAADWKVIWLTDPNGTVLKGGITQADGIVIFRIREGQAFYVQSPNNYSDWWKAKNGYNPSIWRLSYENGDTARLTSINNGDYMYAPLKLALYKNSGYGISCTDGDGRDFYSNSSVFFRSNTIEYATPIYDFCLDKDTLIEELCNRTSLSYEAYDCPYGCSGGACIKGTAPASEQSESQPVTPKAPNPPPSNQVSWSDADIPVYPGWNMFSLSNSGESLFSTCSGFNESAIWMFDPFNKLYIHPQNLVAEYGYWFYSREKCMIRFRGRIFSADGFALHDGWNLVGSVFTPVRFDEIKGTCDIVKGPYSFNADSQAYGPATTMIFGQAYFIKVRGNCRLGALPRPPSPPKEG